MDIVIKNEKIELLPEKAIFWPSFELIAVADLCIKEKPTLKKEMIVKTSKEISVDLKSLQQLILKKKAKRCVLLGDLVYPEKGSLKPLLQDLQWWTSKIGCPLYLCMKCDEKEITVKYLHEMGIVACGDPLIIPPFAFTREPTDIDGYYSFCGHVHPFVILKHQKENLRLPCFFLRQNHGILPSFGPVKNGHTVSWTTTDRVFATTGEKVVPV